MKMRVIVRALISTGAFFNDDYDGFVIMMTMTMKTMMILMMMMMTTVMITMMMTTVTMILHRNFPAGWGVGSKSFLEESGKPWSGNYKGKHGLIVIITIIIYFLIIFITIIIC